MNKSRIKKQRESIETLVNRLLDYDIISFDIFDTLILRPFTKPTDLFRVLSPKYNVVNFANYRITAERNLRKKKLKEYGHREVTLEEIYNELYKSLGIDKKEGFNNEFEAEFNFCYANPYMKAVFDRLLQEGKEIIIISDMYIRKEYMAKILENCGYTGYSKLYVSCDYKVSKRNGELYKLVDEEYVKDKKIIHIGDKKDVDLKKPREYGWHSLHYPSVVDVGKDYHSEMSNTVGSFYNAIVNNYFNNGILNDSPYNDVNYYYGFVYSGLNILGYVNWIHEYAVQNKMDKILFLARDGYILQKVYDLLFDDIPTEYVLWSRHATLKTIGNKDIERYVWQFVTRRVKANREITIIEILKDMHLESLVDKFSIQNIDVETRFTSKTKKIFMDVIKENSNIVKSLCNNYSDAAKTYFAPFVEGCKNVCIVDVGYRASGAIALKQLFENDWEFNCKVTALINFGIVKKDSFDDTYALNNDVISYTFSDLINSDLYFNKDTMLLNIGVIEILISSAPTPSFLYFDFDETKEVVPVFSRPEVENYDRINLIHQGIIDFVREYMLHANKYKFLLNIPSRDSFMPLKKLFSGEGYRAFKKDYTDFSYSYMVGGIEGSNINTFGKMCNFIEKENRRKKSFLRRTYSFSKRKLRKIVRKIRRRDK